MRLSLCELNLSRYFASVYGVISRLQFGGTIEDVQRVIGSLSLSLLDSNYQAYTLNCDSNYRSGRRHKGTLGMCIRAYSYGSDQRQVKCITERIYGEAAVPIRSTFVAVPIAIRLAFCRP